MRRMSIRRAYFNCKKRSIYCESVVVNRSALSVKYSRKTLALSTDVMTRNILHYSFSYGVHHPLMLLDHLKYLFQHMLSAFNFMVLHPSTFSESSK